MSQPAQPTPPHKSEDIMTRLTPAQRLRAERKSEKRWADHYFKLWQQAQEAAKLALADNERAYQNTGHNALSYETREALRKVVDEPARAAR